ncbi:MAG: sulfite exporter TauE/SafE family protein [Bacteroidia bacterium]
MLYLTAFLTGLFSSFHCAGMCGPIAFALPGKEKSGFAFYFGRFVYNSGRMFTYMLLGIILGAFGLGLKLAGIQQSLSIAAGLIIIITVLIGYYKKGNIAFNPLKLFSNQLFKKLFQQANYISLFSIGLLNGLLPCGFVYIALIGASATQDVQHGALFMLLFGLGTLPMMFGVSIIGQFLSSSIRSNISKLTPYLAILIGCMFILRGMNLGIPYLSPKIQVESKLDVNCHSPVNEVAK